MPSTIPRRKPSLYLLIMLLQVHLSHSLGMHRNHTAIPAVPCLLNQASALLRLKRSFSITNESTCTLGSWRAGTDCCRWEGVRCGDASGRVTSLHLGECGLETAALDLAIFSLTSLKYLNLAWNDFKGSQLPATGFERLTELTHLNLSSSSFAGRVPIGIRRLTNLVSIDLSTDFEVVALLGDGYRLFTQSSTHPLAQLIEPNFESLIANLSNLWELHLGFVNLSSSGAQWCDALARFSPKLRVLRLPFCSISGPICRSLTRLVSLTVIDLRYNGLPGPFPNFLSDLSNLSVLQLAHNKLEGWVFPTMLQHNKLVSIDLHHNLKISGNLPNFSADASLKELAVGQTNFSGTIPTSIGNLKSLVWLDLASGGFSEKLPTSIGSLKSLNVLQISGGLSGSIPSWIANLTSLRVLQFWHCGLSGSIPSSIGGLTKLEELALCGCNFSGQIPPQISNLTQLRVLLLYSNKFSGTVELAPLFKLPYLFSLDLSDNQLVVVDGEYNSSLLSSFPKLDTLGLSSCKISKFPNLLRYQDEIVWLELSNNQIQGAIPQWAWETWKNNFFHLNLANNNLTSVGYGPFLPLHVEVLDLSQNMFEGPIPIPQGSATMLDYSHNRFSSVPFNFNTHISDVAYFMASENKFSGEIPPSFCSATSLLLLDLSYNNFSGSIPPCIMEDITTLQVLNLKGNQLHGEFSDNIKEGCSFQALDFSGNMIGGQLPRSLVSCKNLEVLDIGNNQVSDSFPCWMSTLHRLQVLVLKSNKFFGQVAQTLVKGKDACEFPSVRIVDLSSNNFSGPLPQDQWFKKLKSMMIRYSNTTLVMDHEVPQEAYHSYNFTTAVTYKGQDVTFAKILRTLVLIDVSNNAFHGSIPEAVGELVLLNVLNMSHNSLTGPVPSQLGRLNQLESLDLSSNELSGEIPQEIASLDFLAMLNLSYNKLEGRIPESPHFLTFSNSSFQGNDRLCGPPLSKECSNTTTPNVAPHPSKKNSADIMLFLFAGLGFGVGFAIVIVVTWGIRIRKRS